jgi:hypothetical protein
MGIDIYPGGAHWSYSGFHAFRKALAQEVGIDLDEMVGFGGETPWPNSKKEPIVHLLNHSDCDGKMTPKQCRACAPRLRELISKWDIADYSTSSALKLVGGMEVAAKNDEPLVFG